MSGSDAEYKLHTFLFGPCFVVKPLVILRHAQKTPDDRKSRRPRGKTFALILNVVVPLAPDVQTTEYAETCSDGEIRETGA